MTERKYYKGKRVLVTGHTGFKGSWLCQMLLALGAEVTGYALDPPTEPSLFSLRGLEKEMRSVTGDIRDAELLEKTLRKAKPEVLIHMAARSLVSQGYEDPVETYDVNLMGTVRALEAARHCENLASVLVVTTDKVYKNEGSGQAFAEDDALGAEDPYAGSKACAEIATDTYRASFFTERNLPISTLRAGNVIGGGDFAKHRLIPDCVRAALSGETLTLRDPAGTRPYQHVIDPLALYLRIAEAQAEDPALAGAYNIGPKEEITAGELAERFFRAWNAAEGTAEKADQIRVAKERPFREAHALSLDSSRAQETFGWEAADTIDAALEETVTFARCYRDGGDLRAHMEKWAGIYLSKEADF